MEKWVTMILVLTQVNIVISQGLFENATSRYLPDSFSRSSLFLGILDLNGDHFDDIISLNEGNEIKVALYNGPGYLLESIPSANKLAVRPEWSFALGDLDRDGWLEVMTTGLSNGIKVYKYNPEKREYELSQRINTSAYGQGCNTVDYNNDGYLDLFISDDQGPSDLYINDGMGKLSILEDAIDFQTSPASDMSGNYGSEWVDLDDDGVLELFMAKCSQFANLASDPRRINQLYKKNKAGNYIDIADSIGLADGGQAWTSVFADVDNDGDLDLALAHHYSPHLFYENMDGKFVPRSFPTDEVIFSFQIVEGDFDNNGFIDFYYTGTKDFLLLNEGEWNFKMIEKPLNGFTVHTASAGDLNQDGFLDIFAGFGLAINDPGDRFDEIWCGIPNSNHFLTFYLEGQDNNREAIGTKVLLYGPWGIQQRNVRGGQGYSLTTSRNVYFGLGTATTVDSVVVIWPGGEKQHFSGVMADKTYLIRESDNISEVLSWNDERPCLGDILQAPLVNAVSYLWNTGQTSPTVEIQDGEYYWVRIEDENGITYQTKALSSYSGLQRNIPIFPDDTMRICQNSILKINNLPGANFQWSSGDTTAQVVITNTGNYELTITDQCGFSSVDSIQIVLENVSENPRRDTINLGEDFIFKEQGTKVFWYLDSLDEEPIFDANEWTLEAVVRDTQFFIEKWEYSLKDVDTVTGNLGEGPGIYILDHLNPEMVFNVTQRFTLLNIDVFTDKPGKRTFELYHPDDYLVKKIDRELKVGKNTIEFGLELMAGEGYYLTTNGQQNLESLGHLGPRLQVALEENIFPIRNNIIDLLGSRTGQGYYFYFNWAGMQSEKICRSERYKKELIVRLIDNTLDPFLLNGKVYPNPANHEIFIRELEPGTDILFYDASGRLVYESVLDDQHAIDVHLLESGYYFLKIITRNKSYTSKFIKI